jgi:hypothetical protein
MAIAPTCFWMANALAYSQDGATLALHVAPASYSGCEVIADDSLGCDDLRVEGDSSTVQLVFVLVSGVAEITGVQFAVDDQSITPSSWTLCTGGRQVTEPGWPEQGTGIAVTWPGLHGSEGGLAIVGYFTVAAGQDGILSLAPDHRTGSAVYVDGYMMEQELAEFSVVDVAGAGAGLSRCVPASEAVSAPILRFPEMSQVLVTASVDSVWSEEYTKPTGNTIVRTGLRGRVVEVLLGEWDGSEVMFFAAGGCRYDQAAGRTICLENEIYNPGGVQALPGQDLLLSARLLSPEHVEAPTWALLETLELTDDGAVARISGVPNGAWMTTSESAVNRTEVGTIDAVRSVAHRMERPKRSDLEEQADLVVLATVLEHAVDVVDVHGRQLRVSEPPGNSVHAWSQVLLKVHEVLKPDRSRPSPKDLLEVRALHRMSPGVTVDRRRLVPTIIPGYRAVAFLSFDASREKYVLTGGDAALVYEYGNGDYPGASPEALR